MGAGTEYIVAVDSVTVITSFSREVACFSVCVCFCDSRNLGKEYAVHVSIFKGNIMFFSIT